MSNSVQPYGLQPARLLCPRDSQARIVEWVVMPDLQEIFPTQGLNLHLLRLRVLAGWFSTTSTTWEAQYAVLIYPVVSDSLQPHGP